MARRRHGGTRYWWKDALALAVGAGIAGAGFAAVAAVVPATVVPTGAATPTVPIVSAHQPGQAPATRAVAEPWVAKPAPAPAPDMLTVKRVLPIDGPIGFGEWHWDDSGVPSGPLIVTVDLAAETISVFRDGYEIGTAAILYGADEAPTPLGTYPITQKDRDHHSSTYAGAPMPYMLRLTNDGVSIHGSKVEWGAATHGCIGVPVPFAAKLFAVAKVGDRVIVTRGKRLGVGGAIAPTA